MNKIFFFIGLFFSILPLWSQNVTEQNIQGKWKMVNYITASANLDLQTGKVTLDKTAYSFGQETADKLKSDMQSYSEMLKTATVEIKGNNFTQEISDSLLVGTFTIETKDDHQVLKGKFDNGTNGTIRIALQEGKLILTYPGQNKTYIYKKG